MEKLGFLILEFGETNVLNEAQAIRETVERAGQSAVDISNHRCMNEKDILTVVSTMKPAWIHIISESEKKNLLLKAEKMTAIRINKYDLTRKLQIASPNLCFLGFNSRLSELDYENFSILSAAIGMEKGYNPIAMRQFAPVFYGNMAGGMTLGASFRHAFDNVQKEVLFRFGGPYMCFNTDIDPDSFAFLPRKNVFMN